MKQPNERTKQKNPATWSIVKWFYNPLKTTVLEFSSETGTKKLLTLIREALFCHFHHHDILSEALHLSTCAIFQEAIFYY